MDVLHIFIIITMTTTGISCSKYDEYGRKEDKLVLNAVELIDLVQEEQRQNADHPPAGQDAKTSAFRLANQDLESSTTEDDTKDDKALKTRKVWSRWSKWSECSVTCGSGTITRRRACVAGRCAPGEMEEQRRACDRTPCSLYATGGAELTDDTHYTE